MGDWAVIDGVNTILGDGRFAVVEDEVFSWKLYSDTLLILFL